MVGIALEHSKDEIRKLCWNRRVDRIEAREHAGDELGEHFFEHWRSREKRPSERLVQDDSERPDVGAVVDSFFSEGLLR